MIDCSIDFNVNDLVLPDVEALLGRIAPVLEDESGESWRIDARGVGYLGPSAVVLLATAYLESKRRGISGELLLPNEPAALRAFCHFSGLQELTGTGDAPNPNHPDNETAPILQFTGESFNQSTPLVGLVRRHVPSMSVDSEDILRRCFAEVAQNVEDHAESLVGGVACGRFMLGSREVRIAFADHGLGVAETLRRSGHRVSSDAEALRRVLRGGLSSRSRRNNMGLGISNLSDMARGHGGQLLLLSGAALVRVSAESEDAWIRQLNVNYPGTAVFMGLNVDLDAEHEIE